MIQVGDRAVEHRPKHVVVEGGGVGISVVIGDACGPYRVQVGVVVRAVAAGRNGYTVRRRRWFR